MEPMSSLSRVIGLLHHRLSGEMHPGKRSLGNSLPEHVVTNILAGADTKTADRMFLSRVADFVNMIAGQGAEGGGVWP